jgi:pyruvate dehydrogenase (quinone)
VIALVGDGAMQMSNMAELITVAKYWNRWGDPRWICCVFNNEDLTQVTWEQRGLAGDPKFERSQNVPFLQYSKFAELIGLKGIFVDDSERLGPAWEEALASDRPVVLDVKTDPNVPPLPSHVSTEQAVKFAKSLIKGDPDERSVILNPAKELWGTIFPWRKT